MDRIEKLLEPVKQARKYLESSEINKWLESDDCSKEEKTKWRKLLVDFLVLEDELENDKLRILVEQFDKLKPSLDAGITAFKKEIEEMDEFAKTMNTLGNVLGLIGKVVTVATVPHIAPLAVINDLMRARSDHDLRMVRYSLRDTPHLFAMQPKSHVEFETMPESHLEKKEPLFLIEEVLHGVELTPEKLVITVATGGCTEKGDFRFDVNKMASPYMVTVYRIVSDDCKGEFEPIQIPYSREELGLKDGVEFVLRNKIGNTSQHRLNS
jgi:hypothetical protein